MTACGRDGVAGVHVRSEQGKSWGSRLCIADEPEHVTFYNRVNGNKNDAHEVDSPPGQGRLPLPPAKCYIEWSLQPEPAPKPEG